MNATEDWLRYIESKVIMQKYDIKGYEHKKETEEEENEEESTKESDDV